MTKAIQSFICEPKRTAIGSFGGALSSVPATELGSKLVARIVESTKIDPAKINELILGCVLSSGLGQAPARQVAIRSGLPTTVQAFAVNKVCSSGLFAVMLADRNIRLGVSEAIIAGGIESMSHAPYLMTTLRGGARLGHTTALDSILRDGLWDPYHDYHMGSAAELCARENKISREDQDRFATESYRRATEAIAKGYFKDEIVPIEVTLGKQTTLVDTDEEPGRAKLDKIPTLRPAFEKDGTVTAANASSINDGAAAMIVCTEEFASKNNLNPLAKIVEQGWYGQAPEWFTTAPVGAVNSLLSKTKFKISEIDLFEINEAFSAVALACSSKLEIPSEKLNINGGAVALGHPIGASGARVLTTLIHGLKRTGGKRGVAAICNGGGEATSILIETV